MTDRLFRLLPWAPCGALGIALLELPVHLLSDRPLTAFLVAPGMRELVIFWLVPTFVVLLHLGFTRSLSTVEKCLWRRSLLVGGCGVALIYLCSADRRMPPDPTGRA